MADNEKKTPDYLAKYDTDKAKSKKKAINHARGRCPYSCEGTTLARGSGGNECSGSGSGSDIDSDAPAPVGQIHDLFTEYEEHFSLPKFKWKAARSTLLDCLVRETAAGSIPRGVIQGEPRVAADDSISDNDARLHATETCYRPCEVRY